MKRSNRLVLLVGVFLAVIAFVGVIVLSGGGRGTTAVDPNAPKTELPTVIALTDIPLGTEIRAEQVETRVIPVEGRDIDAFGDVSQVIGQVAREEVKAGAAVTGGTLTGGAAGRIVNIDVQPGYRAMSVQVDQVTGVGTLIKPGDYVDMVIRVEPTGISLDPETGIPLTAAEQGPEAGAGITATSTKLILQGMQVIGTLLPPTTPTGTEVQPGAAPDQGTALSADGQEIVILSLTPAQTEVVKWAQTELVSFSLVLRSPDDFVDADGNPLLAESPCTTVRPVPAPGANPSPDPAASEEPVEPFPCEGTPGVVLKSLIEEYGVLVNSSIFFAGIEDAPDEIAFPTLGPDAFTEE